MSKTETIKRYDDFSIFGTRSKDGVFAAFDWRHMVLAPGAAITAKASNGSDRLGAFHGEVWPLLVEKLGHYSDVQSINSEDTVTWSVFGANPSGDWVLRLLHEAFGPAARPPHWHVSLWQTTKHPDGSGRGPEADVIIESVGLPWRYVLEAKWGSDIGDRQGKDKTKTQIDMRFFTASQGVPLLQSGVLVVVPSPARYLVEKRPVFSRYFEVQGDAYVSKVPRLSVLTWERVADVFGGEVKEYVDWRLSHLRSA